MGYLEEITGSKNELKEGDSGQYMLAIKQLINKYLAINGMQDQLLELNNSFDLKMEKRIMEIQGKLNVSKTGIIDDTLYKTISDEVNKNMSDNLEDDSTDSSESSESESKSAHYNSFFNTENSKDTRINKKDIIIRIGNGMTRTIKDVYMRSTGFEVDTSGNPIAETYEFIARDIIESEEPGDAIGYENEQETAPSDIKRKYNFSRTRDFGGGGKSFDEETEPEMGGGGRQF